ncbi:MAG: hypothetical protein ACRCZF_12620, partial [Gemmataceae bacterium]
MVASGAGLGKMINSATDRAAFLTTSILFDATHFLYTLRAHVGQPEYRSIDHVYTRFPSMIARHTRLLRVIDL